MPDPTVPNPNSRTPPSIIGTIIGLSAIASLFLAWLVSTIIRPSTPPEPT